MHGGVAVRSVWGSTSKYRPPHHKYKSPKQSLSITYFETSELNGSKRN